MTRAPRIPVTEAQIDRVVEQFYRHTRAHPDLGPVFAVHVADWPAHEAKIGRFWRNALLLQSCYDGNPMQIHKAAGNVRTWHFQIWLKLFDAVLERELPDELAQAWSALAHRIGRGLSMGLPQEDGDSGVPRLSRAGPRENLHDSSAVKGRASGGSDPNA
ncbi:hemoglobin [Jannaschia faecimaris]|uniref:Hemoglobin n=1 Tax=Jannaschia faecimaris TaxID=1244108 RepID=A0A1H3R2D6_9RHOB|nr:hemoglobin [Jannaschia faecimaris]